MQLKHGNHKGVSLYSTNDSHVIFLVVASKIKMKQFYQTSYIVYPISYLINLTVININHVISDSYFHLQFHYTVHSYFSITVLAAPGLILPKS